MGVRGPTVHFPRAALWDAATPGKPFWEPQFLEVDLGSVQPESMTTAIQAPTTMLALTHSPADTTEPPQDIAMAINQHLHGALEQLQWTSSAASTPVSQQIMPRKEPPSVALGAPPSTAGTEDPLRWKETGLVIPTLAATFTQTPDGWPHQATPPALPWPFPHCSTWLYHRHWRWRASPLSHSTTPLPGLGWPDWLMRSSSY